MDALFQIVTFCIPKAGVQVGGVPLTLNLLLLAWVIVRHPNDTVLAIQRFRWVGYLYAILLFFGSITFVLSIGHWKTFKLAEIIVVLASPLACVFASRMDVERMMKVTCCALVIVGAYAAVQFAFGIVSTSIQGLTYTYGQDIMYKPIGYGMGNSGDDSANKMPSTYANGNYLGIFDVLGITIMLCWHAKERFWKIMRLLAIACGAIGLMLCGSRSIVIPFIASCLFLLIQRYRAWPRRMKGTYLFFTILALIGICCYLALFQSSVVSHFLNRIVEQTATDSTGAGRTAQWTKLVHNMFLLAPLQVVRLMLVGQGSTYQLGGEGMPEFFATFGAISTMAFYGMIVAGAVYCWKNMATRPIAFGLLCSAVAFSVDQSFYYPPTVMEVFMTLGIAATILHGQMRDMESSHIRLHRVS